MSMSNSDAFTKRSKNTENAATSQIGFGSSLGGPSSTLEIATGFENGVAVVGATVNVSSSLFCNSSAPTTTSISFGGTTNVVSTSTNPIFSLGIGASANASLGLSFGANATAATTSIFPFSLETAKTTSPSNCTQLIPGATTNTTATTTTTPAQNIADPALEMPVPNEVLQSVNHLKEFLKQQKYMATEIAYMSSKRSNEVSIDLTMYQQNLKLIEHNLEKQKSSIEKLKNDIYKCIQDFGIIQRNHDHPDMSPNDMESNLKYFSELIKSTQEKTIILKNEIENIQQYLSMLPCNNNVTVNELRRLGEVYYKNTIALAGHLHGVHNKVQVLKARHLSFRKEILNDHTNIF